MCAWALVSRGRRQKQKTDIKGFLCRAIAFDKTIACDNLEGRVSLMNSWFWGESRMLVTLDIC